ncbi:LOW QUALITY PROTEIN: hypothetical protein BRADI_1g48939v3 [Brachypodium distachyon]|uniref:Uncharacterized protein n=1 Tax=Brachypodium distachyon TaxID=15368 RepID=A0A2K2DQE8_BRADI|nr:LOW QUALITY PROTEIN: hypothetical protein BRADI_1g48939v3 [Brachypodium distachyon]
MSPPSESSSSSSCAVYPLPGVSDRSPIDVSDAARRNSGRHISPDRWVKLNQTPSAALDLASDAGAVLHLASDAGAALQVRRNSLQSVPSRALPLRRLRRYLLASRRPCSPSVASSRAGPLLASPSPCSQAQPPSSQAPRRAHSSPPREPVALLTTCRLLASGLSRRPARVPGPSSRAASAAAQAAAFACRAREPRPPLPLLADRQRGCSQPVAATGRPSQGLGDWKERRGNELFGRDFCASRP